MTATDTAPDHQDSRALAQGARETIPDAAHTYASGLSLSALAGRREGMEPGRLNHDRDRAFLLSTTLDAESRTLLAAAIATMTVYTTRDAARKPSEEFPTPFMQEPINRGILGPSLVISYSHNDNDIDETIEATRSALQAHERGLDNGGDTAIEGRLARPVDHRRD